jgi:peptidoglycan/LPS O-acetylase OafA/YrhL
LRRLAFLDSLRGLAAIYVVVFHMIFIPRPNLSVPPWASKFAETGATGVTLFFVLSAFSLFYTMPLRLKEAKPSVSFYVHRLFRIAPLFCAWIVLSVVRDAWWFSSHHGVWEILTNVFFVFNFVPNHQEGIVWASWTIGIEILFYAMFPLMYRLTKNAFDALALALAFMLFWVAFRTVIGSLPIDGTMKQSIFQWTFLRYLPIFASGGICYFFIRERLSGEDRPLDKSLGRLLVLLAVLGYTAWLDGALSWRFTDALQWQTIIYATLLVGLGLYPTWLIVNRATCYLGKVSYSLYLNHPTIVFALIPVYRRIYALAPDTSIAFVTSYALTLAVLIPSSALTYSLIEEPGIRLGKRLYRWWERQANRPILRISEDHHRSTTPMVSVVGHTHPPIRDDRGGWRAEAEPPTDSAGSPIRG